MQKLGIKMWQNFYIPELQTQDAAKVTCFSVVQLLKALEFYENSQMFTTTQRE